MKKIFLGFAILFLALPAFSTVIVWPDVLVATTASVAHSGLQTIDDINLGTGARVLDKDNSTATLRGIWIVASGSWTRATDADADAEVVSGNTVTVLRGTANHGKVFELTTSDPITLGVTSLTFTQIGLVSIGSAASANALKSATTIINVAASAAPSSGKVLTATDSTHATWQTPSGGTDTKAEKVILASIAVTSSLADSNWDDLGTYTLPAGKLATNGDAIRIRAWGSFGGSGFIRIRFGGTTLLQGVGSIGRMWDASAMVVRVGATNQKAYGHLEFDTGVNEFANPTSPTETLSGTVAIAVEGGVTAIAGDTVCYMIQIEYIPAP